MTVVQKTKGMPRINQNRQFPNKGRIVPAKGETPLSRSTNSWVRNHKATVRQPNCANIRYNIRALAKVWEPYQKELQCTADGSPRTPRLAEEDPPGTEYGTCKDEDSPYDNDDDERLSYCSIESAQGSTGPVHPSITSSSSFDTDFPTTNYLPVPFSKDPDPEIDIGVRETRKHAGQAGRPHDSGSDVSVEQFYTHDIICIRMIREFEN